MSSEEAVDAAMDSGLVSMTDIFILSLAGGFAFYWFFVRNRKQDVPNFKKLTIAWVIFIINKQNCQICYFDMLNMFWCANI